MQIRPEQPKDTTAIHALTQAAFAPKTFSDGTEADVINGLRTQGALTLSLVAHDGDKIIGHVAFSPVLIDGQSGWTGLGPVAVIPDLQRRGIGTALIAEGLTQMKARGAKGCALIGDPNYYARFGFISDGALTYGDVAARNVQWLAFGADTPRGALQFHAAFGD